MRFASIDPGRCRSRSGTEVRRKRAEGRVAAFIKLAHERVPEGVAAGGPKLMVQLVAVRAFPEGESATADRDPYIVGWYLRGRSREAAPKLRVFADL